MTENNQEERQSRRKWTAEEDHLLLRTIEAYPQNLAKCFLLVSEQIDRSNKAVAAHWYQKLSKNPDVWLYATISSKHIARNRKNGIGVESNMSIWRRVLRIIKQMF